METALLGDRFQEFSQSVYDPSEDTFLLIDALEQDLDMLKVIRPSICLEIGSGSGIIITSLAKALGNTCYYLATDVNPLAALTTKSTGIKNNVQVESFISDLGDAVFTRLRGAVDLLLFNPPYVVTPSEEVGNVDITAAWAGGQDGREVIDRLVPSIAAQLLSPTGYFYLLLLKENKPSEVQSSLELFGLESKIVLSRRCGAEQLCVLRSRHKNTPTVSQS